jgi:2-polyprenyl-6-methoxyphenol hydroxylase-like FAD-dependent oxidoreductase
MSWFSKACDVLVVGAGPTGLFTALELARRGVSVRVIEEQWRTTSRSYALGLHPRTLDLLDIHGIADSLVAKGHRIDGVSLRDATGEKASLDLAAGGPKRPFLLVLPQYALEAAFEQALEKAGVKIEWNHRLASVEGRDGGVVARVQRLGKDSVGYAAATTEWVIDKESDVPVKFVVGADGHRSRVRRSAGIGYEQVAPSELFAVFEFAAKHDDVHDSSVILDDAATSVLWPMGHGRFRWGFQVTDEGAAEDDRTKSRLLVGFDADSFPAVPPEQLGAFVAARAPWFSAQVTEVFWSAAIRFERRLAGAFGAGSVWLAGDSGHLAGPVGMQSMNVGLREGHNLAWAIAERLRGASGDALADYGAARLREWRQLLGVEHAVRASSSATPWVRERAARILSCAPASGRTLGRMLAPLGLEFDAPEEWTL